MGSLRRWSNGLLFSGLLLTASAAEAAVTVNKTFSPSSMTVNGTSTITVTLGNTGTAAATGTAFTDNLPGGLVVASPSNVATSCGGTASATSGGSTISLSGGTIPPGGGTCTVTAAVTSTTLGNYTNTIPAGAVTSSQGSNGSAASATLAVLAAQPITANWAGAWPPSFGGRLKGNGAPESITLTLNNVNTIALTNVTVPLTLFQPVLTFATPANESTTCGSGTLSLTATGLTLSGGTIPAGGNCTIKFDIIAAQPNTPYFANAPVSVPAGAITDSQGVTNTNAFVSNIPVQTGSSIAKAFVPNSIVSGGTSTVTLTINNFNYSALSPIDLTDPLPSNSSGTMTVAPVPNASTTCGGSLTATPGAASVQLSGGSLPSVAPNASTGVNCTVTFDVVATTPRTTAVNLTNLIPAGNFGGVGYGAVSALLNVLPNQPLYGSKKVISNQNYAGNELTFAGTTHSVTITLNNTTAAPITVTSLTDDVSTMGPGFVVASDTPPSTTCAGGTVTATPGGTIISMAGGAIPPSDGTTPGTCTVTAGLYIPLTAAAIGGRTNTIPAGAVVTTAGSNTTPITFGISVYTPLSIAKSFSPASVNPGGTSTMTLTIVRRSAAGEINGDPLTGISASDTLPAGMVIATPSGLATTCNAGATVTAPAGGSTVSFSGVNLDYATNCTVTVNVMVPPGTPPGILTNLIPANSATTDQGVTNSTTPSSGGGYGNGQASANLTVTSANLTINKTFTPATVAVGTVSQLAINFINTNPGNIALTQAALLDNLPVGMTVASPAGASFTGSGCAGTVTAAVGSSSVGVSNATVNAGSTCTLKVNVVGTAAGNLINTIAAGAFTSLQGVTNSAPATATLQATGTANLGITKTDGRTQVATGTSTTYTLVVSNTGPNNVIGTTVADTPPAGMTFTSWTCAASGGAACGAASGTGPINDTININVGSTVTYTVTAQVAPNFAGGSITNTASVTPPGIVSDPDQTNNSASDVDTVVSGVVLALTKTDGSASYTPGGNATYTITVANTGAATATQVNVSDALPSGVTLSGNVTCTPAGTATCGTVTGGAGQTSFTATNATLPSGASNTLTFAVPVTFASTLTTSPLVNTVTATDSVSGATGTASDSDTLDASANVSIAKTGTASVVPGAPISYTLTIANAGPSAANNATFNDAVPASITGVTASCGGAAGGAVCPASVTVAGNNVSGTIPTLPPGGSVVVTINGTASPSASAPITNTATVAPPAGTTDPTPGNNTSSWTTNLKPIVRIDKTVDATSVIPGDTITYTVTVTNTGTVAANGTLVTDAMPNGIDGWTWTCAASGGAACPVGSGSGDLNQTIATLPPGGALVYTMTATVSNTPPTNINNTSTATPPNGACAPANTPAPCSASASLPPVPQIGVSKSADTTTVTPGGTIHYTVVVSNTGVVDADGTPVSDPMPVGVASQTWICVASGGAACATASGAGAISDTIATFPAGSFVTYTVTAVVDANPPAIVSNTVTVAPTDPGTVCTPANTPGPCTATANVTSNPQISITKTADTGVLTPGGTVTYTITVANTGAVAADGTTVDDAVPAGIANQSWTCAANAGAICTGNGTGAISDTLTAFPPGSFVTYTIVATIADNPPGTVVNIATANPPAGGLCTPGNTPAPCDAEVSGGAVPQISITKTSDATGPLTPGGTVTYTVTVTNAGSADASNTLVSDPLPAGLASSTWTCAANGGAICPNATGSGDVNETLATFPAGAGVVYTIAAIVDALPPASIVNTASAMPASGVCLPGNTAPPCTATASNASAPQVSVTKIANDPSYVAGGTLSWTVTVTNTGGVAADGTLVSDPLPAGIVSSTWSCLPGGGAACANPTGNGAINETITTLPPGAAVAFIVTGTVAVPAPTSITNTAAATPPAGGTCGAPDNAPPPCVASITTTSAASVAIAKSVADANGNGVAEAGEQLTYTIVLTNSGGSDAIDFGVTDPLDANVAFVSADGGGVLTGHTVTWSGLTVAAGGSVTVHVVATVAAPLPAGVTQIANVAYETGTTAPSCPPIGPGCVVLPTPGVVTLTKSVIDASGDGVADPGESLSYTITLTNTGGSDVVGYGVTDPLDPNLVFVSADNGGTESGGVVDWSDLTVPAGGSLELTLVATVADPLASGVTSVANVAYETGTTAPACPPAGPQCVVLQTPGTASISKSVVDQNGNGFADAGEQLTYTILLSNAGGSDVTDFDVTDPLDANVAFVSASNGGVLTGSVVSWSGLTIPAGGDLALTVVVTVASPLPAGLVAIDNVAYPSAGTPPDCSVLPQPPNCSRLPTAPHVVIAKTAGTPVPTGSPNNYALDYTVTVSNTGGSVGHYDLTDALAFNGANVLATGAPEYASATGDTQTGTLGSFVPPSGGTIVTNEDLSAGGVETWTYTVTYSIDDAVVASDCANPLGGLRNSAALGGGAAGAPPAGTCTGSAGVDIQKIAAAPVPTGNPNEFALTYTVNVTNTGSLDGVYDLSDLLAFNGATIGAISPPAYSSSTGDTQDGTPGVLGPPDGGVIVSGESIGAGGAETWTYTVTYTIIDSAIAQDCADPNGGLRNSAALGGSFAGQSATCTGAPDVVVAKSASGPVPTGNPNEYALTYAVTVQNNGSQAGTYDLDDTFAFPGVSGVSVSAITHSGVDPLATTLGALGAEGGNIVTDESIAAGSSESYTYTTTFTVDDVAAIGTCASGGGLLNNAELGGTKTGQVTTCSDVPSVAITKSASGPTPTGVPDQYALTYTVTVDNPGAATGTYDLADALAYAGATIGEVGAITHGGADPLATVLGTLDAGGGTIVTGETIAGGSSETYTYTVTFTLTDPAIANDCTTAANGLRNLATLGGSASGSAATCNGAPSVTIAKTVADANGNATADPGEALTYTITLANAGAVDQTGFSVTDPLDPNLTFVSADNGGAFASGTVTWNGLTIPANGTLTLTLVVTVADPLPSGVAEIGNVAYETGMTPPACPSPQCAALPTPPVNPGTVTITKTVEDATHDGSAEPGEPLTYTITLANPGGGDVTGFGLTDPLDPNVVFTSADNGGVYAGGAVTWSNLTIPANGSLSLTLVATVANPIPPGVTSIGNVAYATGSAPADCSATPTPSSCAAIAVVPPAGTAQLQIDKTVDTSSTSPGGVLVYTVAVGNVGMAAATNVVVSDPIPNGIASYAWTCAGSGGASCPNASGSGAIDETIATLPAGGMVVYTITSRLTMNPPPSITNVANATGVSVCAPAGSPPPCTAEAVVTVTPGGGTEPIPTPIDSRWMLVLMAMVLTGAAMRGRRRI